MLIRPKKKSGSSALPGLTTGQRVAAIREELDDDLDGSTGLLDILRLRFEAWRDGKVQEALQKRQSVRRKLVETRTETVRSEQKLAEAVHDTRKQEVKHAVEGTQLDYFQSAADQQFLPEIARIALPSLVPPPAPQATFFAPVGSAAAPPISTTGAAPTDDEINQEAYLLLMKFSTGEMDDVKAASELSRLENRYGPLIAQEVKRRVELLLSHVPTSEPEPGKAPGEGMEVA